MTTQLWVLLLSIPYETDRELLGCYSSKELAEAARAALLVEAPHLKDVGDLFIEQLVVDTKPKWPQ